MYPLKFENLYYNKIWGGRDFELFRENLPEGEIGESWDIACHSHGMSRVSNGELKGKTLRELIDEYGEELIGSKIGKEWFPLLVKLINAKDKLSVQVHPDDEYGKKIEGDMGKTEVWYVIEAFEGANIIFGTKGQCTKEEFKAAMENGQLDKYLNKIPVKKGEVYLVKSGLVHAIGEGVVVVEVQQNSDTTYRVYDYDRGRELHVKKAMDVINLDLNAKRSKGITIENEGYSKTYYCLSKDFSLELYDINKCCQEESDKERFYAFTCVDGEGKILYKDGEEKINKGDSILIPASLGEYTLEGNFKLLKSYVPDIAKVESEILNIVK